jgi:lipoprotein NlpD
MKGFSMLSVWRRAVVWSVLLGCGLFLVACSSQKLNRAPVEDRGNPAKPAQVGAELAAPVVKQLPGFENAGKPGYYTVKPGDTMTRIALDNGQPWKDVARWNSIDNPNQIEVGQVLRVVPPVAVAAVSPTGVVTRPVTSSGTAPLPTSPASSAAAAKPSPEASATGDDRVDWSWPVNGPVLAGFDEVKNKGLDLGGAAGESVLAAADGKVVYVGEGLRGYGKLIILKHNNTYLTAYAHNQALLVKEDQSVRKGQKIAEMGSSDTDRVKLHFEVRRQGKPVDPAKFLPAR